MFDIAVAFVLLDDCFWRIILFQDLIPGHDEGDPSKRLTRYKLYYIVCSFLCKYVIDYLWKWNWRKTFACGSKTPAGGACGTSVVDVFDVGCMCDFCTGCTFYVDVCGTFCIGYTCYVDVCGTTALVVHAIWLYVLLMHWLYMLWSVCGTTALVVHAMWMYVGPLYILYTQGGCIWVHCTSCTWCGNALATVRECFVWGYSLCSC